MVVLAVTGDEPDDAKAFVGKTGVTYPAYRDPSSALHEAFGVFAIPFNAVVGADGKILYAETGADVAVIAKHAAAAIEAAKK